MVIGLNCKRCLRDYFQLFMFKWKFMFLKVFYIFRNVPEKRNIQKTVIWFQMNAVGLDGKTFLQPLRLSRL